MSIEREIKALKRMYKDKLTVYRYLVRKDEHGESHMEESKIYEGISCSLSLNKNSRPSKGEITSDTVSEYKLFTEPSIEILDNDLIEVKTKYQVYTGRAGKSFIYPSHTETNFFVERIV